MKMNKVMAIMHMLTGDTPEGILGQNFPWAMSAGEYNSDGTFDPLNYSPTVIYTADPDQKLRPILRSQYDVYALQDCRVLGAEFRSTAPDMDDEVLGLPDFMEQTAWTVRLPFQKPAANVEGPLLKVSPPEFDTEPYFSARST
jgi:hypothetical protein